MGTLVLVIATLLILKMKNLKNYIFVGLGALVLGAGLMWFIKPKPATISVPSEVITVFRDTCINDRILFQLTSEDSVSIYKIVKKGLKSKSKTINPPISKTERVTDTLYLNKPLMKTTYPLERIFENIIVWDTLEVMGTITKWVSSSKIDTTEVIKEKTTTNTIGVQVGKDDSGKDIVKYLPLEVEAQKETWIGLGSSLKYENRPIVDIGLSAQSGRSTMSLYIDPQKGFKVLDSYRVQFNYNLLKLATKPKYKNK